MQTTGIQNWGEAVMASLAGALALFLTAVPKVIGFLLVVLIDFVHSMGVGRKCVAGILAFGVATGQDPACSMRSLHAR
jgi:hypothetical protein